MRKTLFILFLALLVFVPKFAFADDPPPLIADVPAPIVRPDPVPSDSKPDPQLNNEKEPPVVRLVNPIGGVYPKDGKEPTKEQAKGIVNMQVIMGHAIQITLRLLGAITLGVFFYGGFLWLTSAGNSEKVSKGTKSMLYAVIGLFIIFGAYGILSTIISGITSGTPTAAPTKLPARNRDGEGCKSAYALCAADNSEDANAILACDDELTACEQKCVEEYRTCVDNSRKPDASGGGLNGSAVVNCDAEADACVN